MNDLGNSQALENVAKALYPESANRLEGAEDAKARAQASLSAVGQDGSQAASQIEIEVETRRKRMAEERKQFEEKYAEIAKLSAEDRLRLTEVLDAAQVKANENLDKEKQLRVETNALIEQRGALEEVDQRIESLRESNELLQQRNRLEEEGVTGPALDGELELFKLRQKMNRLTADGVELTDELKKKYAELAIEIKKATAAQVAAADPVKQLYAGYKRQIDDTRGQIASLANTITNELGQAMASALTGLIDGTQSAEEAFSTMFRNIGQAFIQMATDMIAKALMMKVLGIFLPGSGAVPGAQGIGQAAIPGFAEGGRPEPNRLSVVGERGPELFIPDSPGTVIPNNAFEAARSAMSGAMSGGSEGGGTSGEGMSRSFSENTNSINTSNSYMRERSMERESREVLGGAGSMVIETQVINNVEYATVEQMRLSNAASAKKARAQVFSDMKNKPAIRRQVGVK